MGRKILKIQYDDVDEGYTLTEGKNNKYLEDFCREEFDKVVKIIGIPKGENLQTPMIIDSIKFIGWRPIKPNSKVNFSLSLNRTGLKDFRLFYGNPDRTSANDMDNHSIYYLYDWFKRVSGLSRENLPTKTKSYGFNRIEIRVK